MNRFLKTNSPWLSLLFLAVTVVVLAYIFRPKYPEYNAGLDETSRLMTDQSKQILIQDIASKQLIDIRPANVHAQGHPANAVNIPLRQLLDKESVGLLDKLLENGQEAVIFGSDELQATAPWLLLQQLGYKNLKLLKGGYTSKNEFKDTPAASNEIPAFDKTAFLVKPELTKATDNQTIRKTTETVIPVRKPASTGGGC
jgi:rhodanese-related sulfurtransferase